VLTCPAGRGLTILMMGHCLKLILVMRLYALQARKSVSLEWIIIMLISVEICLSLVELLNKGLH
jgi:uncharacterized Rmd1/YagE family protein